MAMGPGSPETPGIKNSHWAEGLRPTDPRVLGVRPPDSWDPEGSVPTAPGVPWAPIPPGGLWSPWVLGPPCGPTGMGLRCGGCVLSRTARVPWPTMPWAPHARPPTHPGPQMDSDGDRMYEPEWMLQFPGPPIQSTSSLFTQMFVSSSMSAMKCSTFDCILASRKASLE